MEYIKPKKLQQGDTVAIVSPSWGGPSVFPHIYEAGIVALETLGLKVKEFPTARADAELLYSNPKMRADDINAAFADPEVKAIIVSIGGDDSVRILEYLDDEVIRNNPKILMGYSDTTTLTTYCNRLGLVTYNGPTIMAGLAQWGSLPEAFQEHIKTFLFNPPAIYAYTPFAQYSDGYADWSNIDTGSVVKDPKPTQGWQWLQGDGKTQGILAGGCIEVFEFFKSTEYWPEPEYWNNKILFFETSEDKPSPDLVKFMLRNYGMQGVFDRINALLIGRARDYTSEESQELYAAAKSVIADEFGHAELPLVANMDFGHTDPQYIMPLGVNAELDCERKIFRLLESPCK